MTDEMKMQLLASMLQGAHVGNLVMDNHGTMNFYGSKPAQEPIEDAVVVADTQQTDEDGAEADRQDERPALPKMLDTDEAKALLTQLQQGGVLDAQWQPVNVSKREMAVMASVMSSKLWGSYKWAPFEELWHVQRLANKFDKAMCQRNTSTLMDEYKHILS